MAMDRLLKARREEILAIAEKYGARNVRVFGSTARGDAGTESDIDILVEMNEGRSLLDIVSIKQDIEDLFHRKVDVVTESSISPYIREDVLKEAVNL